MRGKRSFIRISAVAAVAAIVMIVMAACGEDTPQGSGGPNPSPTPTSTTYDEAEWSIVTPAGWTREDATNAADGKKAVRYEGPDGEYLIVVIDPLGSDFVADTVWRYGVKGDGFEIVTKENCTGTREQGCSVDDNRFDGYALWKSGSDPEKVGGHTWYFIFGNTEKTTVDAAMFEEIIEGIRVKG